MPAAGNGDAHITAEFVRRPPDRSPIERDSASAGGLRRLKIVGVALPLAFVLAVELVRSRLIGTEIYYGTQLALAIFIVAAVVVFSFAMFHFIDRAQTEEAQLVADLVRRKGEGHGLYDVLLRISNQEALVSTLAAVAMHARDLLDGDDASVWLNDAAARSVPLEWRDTETVPRGQGVRIAADAEADHSLGDGQAGRSVGSSTEFEESLEVPIQSRSRVLGELRVGRRRALRFTERDRQFLATLSGLASVAITNARMREHEQQSAVLDERERIAREMHDSLAQVLGVTHLRLRSLGSRDDVRAAPATADEVGEIADYCQEAYRDVRGAILDLRESSRADHGLVDSLRAYLDKYSGQCGIATSLQIAANDDPMLAPGSEIQVIRVIQEALTNVRKHSGATSACVRITSKDGMTTFVVEDNGHGFDPALQPDADEFGLHAMRQRMDLIRGTLMIDSAPGRGTRVVAAVPDV